MGGSWRGFDHIGEDAGEKEGIGNSEGESQFSSPG